ncbi:MAG: thiamine pyrophosphate-binding protein [Patescibacteria group bacterium]
MRGTVAELIVAQLSAWGVKTIYGYPGETILLLLDALARQSGIRFVEVRHEANAAFMASAEAKLLGRLGVCLADAGPGAVNLLNGVADASADQVPILALTGSTAGEAETDREESRRLPPEQTLLRPFFAFSAAVASPETAVDILACAMRTALGRGTAAHVAIPRRLLGRLAELEIRPPEPYLIAAPAKAVESLERVIEILNEAERPMILAGKGCRGQGEGVASLAEQWGAGIITTMPAKGVVPGEHPLAVGGLGEGGSEASSDLLAEADLLLVLGATWWPPAYVPQEIRIVQIDANPESIGSRAPVYHGYVGRIAEVLPRLMAGVEAQIRGQWLGRIEAARRRWLERIEYEAVRVTQPMSPQYVMRALEEALAPDAIVALDVGDHAIWFNRVFTGARQEVLASGNWRSMGFGLPAAIQAKLNHPERQVIALVGDGGLNMALPEFATAVQHRAPVKVVVINNGCLATERNRMLAGNLRPEGTGLFNPDFAAYAEACGGHGYRVDRPQELEEALARALRDEEPCIVDIAVEPAMLPTAAPAE